LWCARKYCQLFVDERKNAQLVVRRQWANHTTLWAEGE
jgi:hypothetical protein